MRIATLGALVALACLVLFGTPAFADDPPYGAGKQDSVVSPLLQQFIEQLESPAAQGASQRDSGEFTRSLSGGLTTKDALAAAAAPSKSDTSDDPVRFDSSGNVQVYIHLENTDDDTLQELWDLDADIEIANFDANVVQAWVPTTALDDIAGLDAVEEITAPDYGQTKAGRIVTEGDGIHRADLVRAFSGLSGRGVKVGAISDGVDARGTAQSSNDLPDSIEIDPDNRGSGDEGTALLEIIHDLAPSAQLAFSGPETSLDMVESILWLANEAFDGEGADIIVDDIGHYTEPYFEDGLIALAAEDAVTGGVVFTSAAGNNAVSHYTGQFIDGGDDYHDFDDSSETDIALRVALGFKLHLQWNDQFGSSGNDYDLFVCPPGLKPVKFNLQNDVCDKSDREQDGDDNPYESIYTSSLDYSTADVYIRKFSGNPRQLKLFVTHGEVLEHGVTEGGIIGHPAVPGLLSIGAIYAADPGNDEPQFFSDRGPIEIYFPHRETRNKPDLMGIDGVMITGAGGFGIVNPVSPFSLFLGTSAAAPHVAGIAALVMEAQRKADPAMGKKAVADAVTQKLKDTAIDLGETGHDNTFGYGRADAWAAITSLAGDSSNDALELYSLTTYADTHTVNSTGDGADDDTTDGVCDDGTVDGSTNCTLRAAIQQTNAGTGATIKFNISGSGAQTISPASALPAITKPVFIDGYSQPGASAGTVLIEIDGTNAGSTVDGLMLQGNGNYVRGLAVNSFSRYGIEISSSRNNVLVGNMVGTDAAGSTDEGNGSSGVHISRSDDVLLRGNVISGNDRNGVETSNGGRHHIYGNKIGTNAAGTAGLGNTLAGAHLASRGVVVRDNVISGNDTHGVHLKSNVTQDAVIENNRIGTNDAGTAALANTGSGIFFDGHPKNNLVAKNVIGGNGSHGVRLSGTSVQYNLIAENWIGANAGGADLGNGGSGVHISGGPHDNTVEDNVIAHNTGDGVTITGNNSLGNTIWENSIHDNDGHGIDLGDDGVTANDERDRDSGPNHLQNYPSNITFATRGDDVSVRFTLDVTSNRTYVIDFYACDSSTSGEGQTGLGFTSGSVDLGSLDVTGSATFTASTLLGQFREFSGTTATHVTATSTDTDVRSTSEFAPCVARVDLPELDISVDSVAATEDATTAATFTVGLSSAPSSDMTVKLSSDDTDVATVSPTETTFTNSDFSETITVTGVSDDDADHEATTIRHLISIGGNEYMTAVIPVEVTDDDAPGLTLASTHATADFPTDASVGHFFDGLFGADEANRFNEGDTATYTVQMASEPEGDVTIDLDSSDTGALTVSPSSITFTKTDEASASDKYEWDDAQTVTLTAVSDSDAGIEIEIVSHETRINGKDYVLGRVRALIQDTGLPALTYQQNSVDVEEITIDSEGSTATYTIVPATEPASNLAIRILSSDVDSVTVAPSNHTFTVGTSGNWNTPLTVTVTSVADDDTFDDVAHIRHRTTFDGQEVSWASVKVTVTDDNRAPYFEDGLETTRDLPETAAQGATVGSPITATDLDTGDILTYTLDDPSGLFEIDSNGQISVSATDPPVAHPFDYETGTQEYTMDVEVSDRTTDGLEDKIEVKVLVTNVNERPVITRTDGDDALSYPEETATTRVLHRYRATDPEKGSITWSVEGTDGGDFTIDTSGNLRFASPPDHEAGGSRSITIVATDDGSPAQRGELEVTVTVTDVNEPPEITGDTTINYDENADHPVASYAASDPEQATTNFIWSLGGTDSGDFTINNSGQLQFANTPNFESPADSGRNNVYNVAVLATDDGTPAKTGRFDVAITVKDRNEAPTITGDDALSYPENTATARVLDRYTATDPEKRAVTWSLEGTDKDEFRIDSSGNLYFDGEPDHEVPTASGGDNVYDFLVVATDDGNLGDGTASPLGTMAGMFDVTVTVTNVDEPPVVTGLNTIDDYDENGTGDVADYAADDPETPGNSNDDQVTWTLAGADRGDFDISNSGVLTFKDAPDYERPADSGGNNVYDVTVQAADSNNKRGELHVDVIVQNVDEPPEITGPDTVDDFPENSATNRQVARYAATDPEGATVTLSLTGTDSDDFNLASNGVVTLEESPDYEERSSYSFTVRAKVGTGTTDITNSAARTVTVNIQNLEETGTVTLSTVQPQAETPLTATLEDDDIPTGTTWQWYRASSRGSSGTAITNAVSATYTPVADDVGRFLRVVASYDDGHGDGKSAVGVSSNQVQEVPPQNQPPEFPVGGDYNRTIRENQPAGRSVGLPVRATDPTNDRLTYSIPASDYFEIVDSTGQIRTKAALDHEDQATHTVTVTASDPSNRSDTVPVTITVEDVDETPEISGPNNPEVAENGGTNVATYTATDPDDTGIDWGLTGTDSDAFTLSGGVLTLDAVPDYEEKNRYRVTIEAREQSPGTSVDRLSVTIHVTNVDEPGVVEANVQEPRVGQTLRLEVVDEDDGESVDEWKWERGDPNSPCGTGTNWELIIGATNNSYTPTAADEGKCLRVTAIYSDRAGTGRTEQFLTPETVEFGPYFDIDTATASVRENSSAGTNVGRYRARHSHSGETLTYTLGGTDADHFTINNSGQLTTNATLLDYETLPDHQAMVEITASDTHTPARSATTTVTLTVADECQTTGEPPCAPGRPNVSSASDTSLRVTWSTPRTPSGTSITGYELQYRESDSGEIWISETVSGTDRSHTVENLTKDTTYEVRVRAMNNVNGQYGEWSPSRTGRPGYVPPPPPPPPTPPPPEEREETTATPPSGGGGGGGGGGGAVSPAPVLLPLAGVSLRTLVFTAYAGGENPPAQPLQLWSPVSRRMNFNVSGSAPWLSVAPVSGFSAGPGNRLSLTVSVDASDLSPGSHRAQVVIAGTGFRNPPQRVYVSVNVAPAAFADSRALEYDADNSLSIDLDEALEAVRDYFTGLISLEDVLKIVRLYFTG